MPSRHSSRRHTVVTAARVDVEIIDPGDPPKSEAIDLLVDFMSKTFLLVGEEEGKLGHEPSLYNALLNVIGSVLAAAVLHPEWAYAVWREFPPLFAAAATQNATGLTDLIRVSSSLDRDPYAKENDRG